MQQIVLHCHESCARHRLIVHQEIINRPLSFSLLLGCNASTAAIILSLLGKIDCQAVPNGIKQSLPVILFIFKRDEQCSTIR